MADRVYTNLADKSFAEASAAQEMHKVYSLGIQLDWVNDFLSVVHFRFYGPVKRHTIFFLEFQ